MSKQIRSGKRAICFMIRLNTNQQILEYLMYYNRSVSILALYNSYNNEVTKASDTLTMESLYAN